MRGCAGDSGVSLPPSGHVAPVALMDARTPDDDAVLVARIAAGDETAFAVAYDRHVDVVFGSVVRFLRDREVAEEVVQDAYLAVWRNAAQYAASSGSLLGWLLGIARNKAIDRMRATARRPRLVVLGGPDDDHREALDRVVAAGGQTGIGVDPGPEEAATRAWTRAVVRTALSAMPEPERRALELAYDEGLTQVEIAQRLDWPLGTVKTRTRRALATLRTALEGVPELTSAGLERPIAQAAIAAAQFGAPGGSDAAR